MPGPLQRPGRPLPLARLDRDMRAARRLPHDVEEGKDAGHARMEGFFGTLKQEFFHTGTGRA